jgi:hypothetical protein
MSPDADEDRSIIRANRLRWSGHEALAADARPERDPLALSPARRLLGLALRRMSEDELSAAFVWFADDEPKHWCFHVARDFCHLALSFACILCILHMTRMCAAK